MLHDSEEEQQKVLENLFKKHQETDRREREMDGIFLKTCTNAYKWEKERFCFIGKRKHVMFYTICNFHLYLSLGCSEIFKGGLSLSKNLFYLLEWQAIKNDEKCFLFHFKNSLRSQDI